MLEIGPAQVTPALQALFPAHGYLYQRCFGVLDGVRAGRIFTDHPATPRWGAVQEIPWATLFLGGALDAGKVASLCDVLRRERDVIFGTRPGVPFLDLMPPDPLDDGLDIDFTERSLDVDLERLAETPPGMSLRRIDHELLGRCRWGDLMIEMAGSAEQALAHGLGYCLMRGETILAEANAGPGTRGMIEAGVITDPEQYGRGYGTIVSARTVLECERMGYRTWWNCAKDNPASAAIARKLGYRRQEEYRLLAWLKREPEPPG